ncbi:DUF7218 family protein [Mycolicibacterium sp.]|uniref:DUF7218 family protein n=1 Tax=Mycolicibacterium sp. TaxID=2320850 RepID=UPI003D13DFC3
MLKASMKGQKIYEKLLSEGHSKKMAARIANAAALHGRPRVGGGKRSGSGSYYDWTMDQLKKRAKEMGLKGYSTLTKDDLIHKLRHHH